MEFSIGKRIVGEGHPEFIVAELSGNHHQNYEEAEELVRTAAKLGADAIKLQTYTPDTLTLKSDNKWFVVRGEDQPDAWKNKILYDLYGTAYTPWDWQPKLNKLAKELGLILFSTPFDDTAVDFLESEVNPPVYKIASYEAIHIPLIKKVAETGKPVIISIGFASLEEITLAVDTLKKHGSGEIAVLHCVTTYSDTPVLANMSLSTIADIKKRFDVVGGFSDNTGGIKTPIIASTVAGGSILEKHFILDRDSGGPDARFSIQPEEFEKMVSHIRNAEKGNQEEVLAKVATKDDIQEAMGEPRYGPVNKQESENTIFRPSIWPKKNIKKGEIFTTDNIRVARPEGSLAPKHFEEILGKKAERDIEFATPFSLIDTAS